MLDLLELTDIQNKQNFYCLKAYFIVSSSIEDRAIGRARTRHFWASHLKEIETQYIMVFLVINIGKIDKFLLF